MDVSLQKIREASDIYRNLLATSHHERVKALQLYQEKLLAAQNDWTTVYKIAVELYEGMRAVYTQFHPGLAIQCFVVGKIAAWCSGEEESGETTMLNEAIRYLTDAVNLSRISHGEKSSVYGEARQMLEESRMYLSQTVRGNEY
ncbi:hypothetical protein HK102_007774 [Quaeritorhiza haematococci]|nr:hypothetical protein HK102_007774 [Quaeritorhiza haematococci]